MSRVERGLLALAVLAATAWWWASSRAAPPAPVLLLKPLAILPLAAIALRRPRLLGPWVGLGLVAHSAGDLLLERAPFVAALAAFGLGHALYGAAFLSRRRRWEEVGGGDKLRLGALALAGGLLVPRVLVSAPTDLAPGLTAYALALLAMAGLAQLVGPARPWVPWGALAYVASDALLALDRFTAELPVAHGLVWPLYWLGQAAIAYGWARVDSHPMPE